VADNLSPAEMQFLGGQLSSRAAPSSSSGGLSQSEMDFLTAKPGTTPPASTSSTSTTTSASDSTAVPPGLPYAPPAGTAVRDAANAIVGGLATGLGDVSGGVARLFGATPGTATFTPPPDAQAAMAAHPLLSGGGQFAGQVIGTAPAILSADLAVPAIAAKTGISALASPLVRGAVTGTAQNLLTSGEAPQESLLHRGTMGALIGAPLGYVGGWLGRQFGSDVSLASNQVQDAGKVMSDAGVDLGTTNLPKAGATAVAQGAPATVPQAQQVTKALGDIIGVNLPDVKPATLGAAKATAGQAIGSAAASGSVDANSILNDLAAVETRATQAGVVNPTIKGILKDIQSKIGQGGIISGPDFQNLVRYSGDLDRATNSAVGDVREPAQQIEQLLNRGFAQSSPADVVNAYRTAKTQYKLLIALENNAKQSASNFIDPGRLYRNIAGSLPDIATLGGSGPNPILDKVANFARAAETTFGGSAPATAPAPASPLKWMLGGAGLAGGGEGLNYLLHPGAALADTSTYLANHLPGALLAGGVAVGRYAGQLAGHEYQQSRAFINSLLQRGTQAGNNPLTPWLADVGTTTLPSSGQGRER
jgi:hypothetical protein